MYQQLVERFVFALYAYALLGTLFACVFVTRGLSRIDPGARGAGVKFRLVIFPGVIALWPLLLRRTDFFNVEYALLTAQGPRALDLPSHLVTKYEMEIVLTL
jgi:hypothetical protein